MLLHENAFLRGNWSLWALLYVMGEFALKNGLVVIRNILQVTVCFR